MSRCVVQGEGALHAAIDEVGEQLRQSFSASHCTRKLTDHCQAVIAPGLSFGDKSKEPEVSLVLDFDNNVGEKESHSAFLAIDRNSRAAGRPARHSPSSPIRLRRPRNGTFAPPDGVDDGDGDAIAAGSGYGCAIAVRDCASSVERRSGVVENSVLFKYF